MRAIFDKVAKTAPTTGRVLITGDAVYSERALTTSTIDGVALSPARARASIERLREVCRDAPTVVVPTHDTQSAARLGAGQPVRLPA